MNTEAKSNRRVTVPVILRSGHRLVLANSDNVIGSSMVSTQVARRFSSTPGSGYKDSQGTLIEKPPKGWTMGTISRPYANKLLTCQAGPSHACGSLGEFLTVKAI